MSRTIIVLLSCLIIVACSFAVEWLRRRTTKHKAVVMAAKIVAVDKPGGMLDVWSLLTLDERRALLLVGERMLHSARVRGKLRIAVGTTDWRKEGEYAALDACIAFAREMLQRAPEAAPTSSPSVGLASAVRDGVRDGIVGALAAVPEGGLAHGPTIVDAAPAHTHGDDEPPCSRCGKAVKNTERAVALSDGRTYHYDHAPAVLS